MSCSARSRSYSDSSAREEMEEVSDSVEGLVSWDGVGRAGRAVFGVIADGGGVGGAW
jgi:hypothetical protein